MTGRKQSDKIQILAVYCLLIGFPPNIYVIFFAQPWDFFRRSMVSA